MSRVSILDHGYLEFVESWGSDERVVEAARMSTNKGFLGWVRLIRCTVCGKEWECENKSAVCNHDSCHNSPTVEVHPGDHKLLRYLWDHKHATPFEMAGMVIEVQAPIMVFREWHRHRTQSYNEMSARYIPLPDVNYLPTPERCLVVNAKNKQAGAVKGADNLTHESVLEWLEKLSRCYDVCEETYQDGLKRGVPKELARLCVPVGRYTRMRASANLRNWLAFLTLRMAEDSQWEIRMFANAVGDMIARAFPRTWELFCAKKI